MAEERWGTASVEIPSSLPVLALRDLVFFPSMVLPLLVGRAPSVAALRDAEEATGGLLLLLAQKDAESEDPPESGLHRVGTVVRLVQTTGLEDGTRRVVFEGLARAEATTLSRERGSIQARIRALEYADVNEDPPGPELQALLRRVERTFREYVHLHPDLPADLATSISDARSPERGAHLAAGHLLVGPSEKQQLLEMGTLDDLLRGLLLGLEREIEILGIETRLDQEMRRKMEDDRRQHYLHEQLRAIQKELGDGAPEWEDLQSELRSASLPEAVRERAEREFDRLRRMSPIAPEAGVIRSYLEWLISLPWKERTPDNADVVHAREVLEAAHFGLDEVKDRILDHIAVLSLVGQLKGPILCLVGPPGVGKTSLGRSIARALNRRFVRVALGGVRDEGEIRGHRRTYVGSLPGRIVQGIRRAGSRNPVFLLDEVDKLARDGHGDPSAALLEVLDPEQNRSFQDHYLEVDLDLSDVLFVATANTLAGIPEPLQDRMEVIRIPGYLDTEKRTIARDFLVPEQLRRHGLEVDPVDLPDPTIDRIIREYTREAGVRELDRLLARIARKLARRRAEAVDSAALSPVRIGTEDLRGLLGPPRHGQVARDFDIERIGMATGLAWTSAGGEILEVEVSVVPGSGAIQLTGTLGEIMKESAVAAVTFARSRAREMGLPPHFYREVDLHIHIPEGATPKDGPSAGITIAAALVSALTGVPTRPDVAMTGEITLRGRILSVGGLKEKAVAALRSGIATVLLPSGNASEVESLPEEVRERVRFLPVARMDEALDHALTATPMPGLATTGVPGATFGSSADPGTRLSQ